MLCNIPTFSYVIPFRTAIAICLFLVGFMQIIIPCRTSRVTCQPASWHSTFQEGKIWIATKRRQVCGSALTRLLNEATMRQKKQKAVYNSSKCSMPDTYNKKEYTMKSSEVKRFADLYERHLKLLKLQGKSKSTIDAYSRAVRRIRDHYDCCPDKLKKDQLENYFSDLVETHSWSTV